MTIETMLFDPLNGHNDVHRANRETLGGKAYSLTKLEEAGISSPRWLCLTSNFFDSWVQELEDAFPFQELLEANATKVEYRDSLDTALRSIRWSVAQLEVFSSLLEIVGENADAFAVRSSSKHEDLDRHSFAGIYDSFLGVSGSNLKEAVQNCFISSYSERVLAYMNASSFDIESPSFSAIVQHQIVCDVSGVAYSIHPINNHYDTAYINSNFGLGESVVSGGANPDRIEVNKNTMEVTSTFCADKSRRSVINAEGDLSSITVPPNEALSLNTEQVRSITSLLKRVEHVFSYPIEIEWGVCNKELFLFQARPITSWVPLPEEMITNAQEKPVLYLDRALSDGMTMNKAASPLGIDIIRNMELTLLERYVGPINRNISPKDALLFHAGGRNYNNLSIVLSLIKPQKMIETLEPMNAQLSQILSEIDPVSYLPATKPKYLKLWKLKLLPPIIWRARKIIGRIRQGIKNPSKLKTQYDQEIQTFLSRLESLDVDGAPFPAFVQSVQEEIVELLGNTFIPVLVVVNTGANKALAKIFPNPSEEEKLLIDNMKRGFSNNLVVKMGLEIQEMGARLRKAKILSVDAAMLHYDQGTLPSEVLDKLNAFNSEFGHRGPNEMDIAQARHRDSLRPLFAQMLSISENNANSVKGLPLVERQTALRIEAFDSLLGKCDKRKAKKLKNVRAIYDNFGAMRDTPKHIILMGLNKIRQRAIVEGEVLAKQGFIDSPSDIFNLKLSDISEHSAELRECVKKNSEFNLLLERSVVKFPSVIDSRGYIPGNDQTPSVIDDELVGIPISPGIVRGRVKILGSENFPSINQNDIVVAYVTDPGLTPSFINAAGVVLEIGGVLQHGAIVARELGIPCVSSILGATELLQNGQMIEVNGSSGTIRLLE